jgi:hypothetical protein
MTSALTLTYRDLRLLRAIMLVEDTAKLQTKISADGTAHVVAHPDDPERLRVVQLLPDGRVLEVEDLTGSCHEVPWPADAARRAKLVEVDESIAQDLRLLDRQVEQATNTTAPAAPAQTGLAL